jgi:hypothetical protein
MRGRPKTELVLNDAQREQLTALRRGPARVTVVVA